MTTLKKHPRTPAHLFVDDTSYFVSGAIYGRRPLLAQAEIKDYLLSQLAEAFALFNWELHHWVILDNHYHVLGQSKKGDDLSAIFRRVHSISAIFIRKRTDGRTTLNRGVMKYTTENTEFFVLLLCTQRA